MGDAPSRMGPARPDVIGQARPSGCMDPARPDVIGQARPSGRMGPAHLNLRTALRLRRMGTARPDVTTARSLLFRFGRRHAAIPGPRCLQPTVDAADHRSTAPARPRDAAEDEDMVGNGPPRHLAAASFSSTAHG